ncbi:MarR family winged helix-turn-helix transcriptional regulator [Paenibacillus typhae]|uniref:DNA-binding transcriptional regulator, MarR family n=2 Tax=Paenibacillus typhae TaxID=1174501 RepID=A0A1G8S9S7_9BACL|nr:MarR family transcriptional regulator [Paenibacillus typhae]MBY0010921.1 MarR family transcriptional regulator [Paenibacillus typhae]SDJ25954.1 DNA-binding transcriptional regulator, MarR family [Paenibacillus typhae]
MERSPLEAIELEMTILSRRLTSISTYKKYGILDHSAYLLLHQIASNGSAGVKALADEFHLDISTISRQASALEQKGYVFRVPDPQDGRAYTLQMTELGAEALKSDTEVRRDKFAQLLQDFNEAEREQLGRLLQKLNDAVFRVM